MNFLKKIFKTSDESSNDNDDQEKVSLSLDDSFVHNFIKRGGKFLYCLKKEDVTKNLLNIIEENNWDSLTFNNKDLHTYIASINIKTESKFNTNTPLFTTCEYLISENGSLLFSSNQIKEKRVSTLTNDFIVLATTSQIVKNMGESLTGIKVKYSGKDLPTNISPIKNYTTHTNIDENFLNYGTNNSKNLYLLLLEDL